MIGPLPTVWRRAICLLDRLVPLKRGVVFRTYPDIEDQGIAVLSALGQTNLHPITWLVSGNPARRAPSIGSHVKVRSAQSVGGILAFVRARVLIHTHGVYGGGRLSKRKLCVNLWHGMPLKRLPNNPRVGRQSDIAIATGAIHADHMAQTWRLKEGGVSALGLPRNDTLLNAPPLPEDLQMAIGSRALALWLPTFRRSADGVVDGEDHGNPFQLPDIDPISLNKALEELGIFCVVKPHPLAASTSADGLLLSHLIVASDEDLSAWGVTLYQLLGHSDVLISDQSSVWVDYLLLDKPIVFAIADIESYSRGRGFYFDPLRNYLPGPVVTTQGGVIGALRESCGEGEAWRTQRREARALHHEHLDNQSANRLMTLILDRLDSDSPSRRVFAFMGTKD